jgi:DNA end-binding protein Ku
MAQAAFNGTFSLGLVNFAFKSYKAKDDASKGIEFKQLHSSCKTPINQKKHCAKCAIDLTEGDIVKGHEYSKGSFVEVDKSELENLMPDNNRVLSIKSVVPLAEIDPLLIEKSYYITPDNNQAAISAFAIIREALKGKAAIGQIEVNQRYHIGAVVPTSAGLTLHFIAFENQIREPQETALPAVDPQMLGLAKQLLSSIEEESLDLSEFKDDYVDKVKELIQDKLAGVQHAPVAAKAPAPTVANLTAALQQSIAVLQAQPKATKVRKAATTKKAGKTKAA